MMILAALLFAALGVGGNPNVNVSVNAEGDLLVIGDAGNNNITFDVEANYPRIRVGNGDSLNGVPGPTEIPLDRPRGRLIVSLGGGDDTIHFSLSIASERIFFLGDGDDFLDMGLVSSASTTIYAGAGDDHVHSEDTDYGELAVHLGPGVDSFELAFSNADALTVVGWGGDDVVRLRQSWHHGPVRLFGGRGVDTFLDIGAIFLAGPPKVYGFEDMP